MTSPRFRRRPALRDLRGWRFSPRLVTLVTSVAWRHASDDPVRALVLAWRVLPHPFRVSLRLAGPYGRAVTLWGAGDRGAALQALDRVPRRLAAFALAVDWPQAARSALGRLGEDDPARAFLAARLAWREGRLADGLRTLDGVRGRRARALRRSLAAELAVLDRGWPPHGLDRARPPRRLPRRGIDPVQGRVLHVVTDALPTTFAGYTVRTHQITLAQRAAGLDPHVVTRCGFPVTQGKLDSRRLVRLDGVPYHRLLPYTLPRQADAAAGRGLELAARLAEGLRPAVLHAATNYANGQLALALRDAYGLPVVYEVRGFLEETWLSRQDRDAGDAAAASDLYRLSRELETHCMLEADLVVTLGEVMLEEIVARGVQAEKVLVVPNAVSGEFLEPLPDGAALRACLGIEPGELVVGLVSSLVAHEGIGTLLAAAAELRRRGLPLRPLIVGDGPERTALEHQASQLGLAGAAIFTGRVPMADVRDYHAILDIFVVPRTNDRVCQLVTPLKPVEAMASGLCVVASEVGALQEIIKQGATGALAAPEDPVALADCLQSLLSSPDVRKQLGANARAWVAEDRTWERNAVRYREAYERLGAA